MKSNTSDSLPGERGLSLWQRISRDPNFLKAKGKIQSRYGLPLPYDIRLDHQKWLDWLGTREKSTNPRAKRGRAFLKEIRALFKKFEVPEAWQDDFIADIAGLSSADSLEEWSRPRFNVYKDSGGNWKWECTITPETDLTNPLILQLIQRGQKEYAGDPPKPVKDKSNPRKFDWRPLYEWHKRHALFTIEEIAKRVDHPPQAVSRAFAELEKDK
jgi:hypothetical protein